MPVETSVEETLRETKERAAIVLRKLRNKIEAGEFQIVLGIDASGRVPALMLGKAIQYKHPISIRFIAGTRHLRREDANSELEKLTEHFSSKDFEGKKVLIVDDVIDKGSSLQLLCKALIKSKVDYEIAALAVTERPISEDSPNSAGADLHFHAKKAELEKTLGGNITYADTDIPLIYGKKQMSGVAKGQSIFGTPLEKEVLRYKSTIPSYGEEVAPPKQNRDVLTYTRKRTEEIAKELAQEMGWV